MKTTNPPRFLSSAAAALAAAFALAPLAAQAGSGSRFIQGPRGGSHQGQFSRTPGNFSASASTTLPGGQTAGRSVTSQKTDTGRTTSARATGFGGRTATYHSTRTDVENGFTRDVSASGPLGASVAKQVAVSKQDDGTVTRTVSTTATPPKS
jgi:hypothetical protein